MDRLTVGGLPGTGTSTLCKLLAAQTGLEYVYAGQLFRDEATARGLSLAEFGKLCQTDESVDQALDAKQAELLASGPILLEGRLSGWLASRDAIPALKVWLVCDDSERVRRVVERDGADPETQLAAMQAREASEADRYGRYYGADLDDLAIYDLVLDSTMNSPEELAKLVLAAFPSG